ncbi:hypothetical protein ACFLUG_03125 [Chloroflexota bacterium]
MKQRIPWDTPNHSFVEKKNGEIPKARRDINGWRVFDDEDIEYLPKLLLPTNNGTT